MSNIIEESVKEFEDKLKVLKNIEEENSNKINDNSDIIQQLSKVKYSIADEKVKETLSLLSKSIEEKLSAYDEPINKHTKQIKAIRESMESMQKMVQITLNTAKIAAFIISGMILLFTLFTFLRDAAK